MEMTLKEIMDTCDDFEEFCDVKGFDKYAIIERGLDLKVYLTTMEADGFGIVNLR